MPRTLRTGPDALSVPDAHDSAPLCGVVPDGGWVGGVREEGEVGAREDGREEVVV